MVVFKKAKRAAAGAAGLEGRRDGQVRARWLVPLQNRQGLAGSRPRYGKTGDFSVRWGRSAPQRKSRRTLKTSLGAESSGLVVSPVEVSKGEAAGGAVGVGVRNAVTTTASKEGGAEGEAGEWMPGGPVARTSWAWAASSFGLEWEAPEMRGAANHSPRTVSRILSAGMAAVWMRGRSWDWSWDRRAIMRPNRETAVSSGWAGSVR